MRAANGRPCLFGVARATRWGMYYDPAKVRAGGPSQFIPPPGEGLAGFSRRYLPAEARFRLRVLQADLGNFFFLQHRHMDGFLVTAKHSGSQWLKFMLSVAIARRHGVSPPAFCTGPRADDIIGHPARPRRYAALPRIATSHTIPSALQRFIPAVAGRAPIVVLVRAIAPTLLAGYRKWRGHYDTISDAPLDAFAAGDPGGRRYIADAWWYVHFFNRWGAWQQADPARILIVRYEDLCADPACVLGQIGGHLRLDLSAGDIAAALEFRTPEAVRARQDPGAIDMIFAAPEAAAAAFSVANRASIHAILRRHLRFPLGYDIAAPAVAAAPS